MRRKKSAQVRVVIFFIAILLVGLFFFLERFTELLVSKKPAVPLAPPGAVVGRWSFDDKGALEQWEEKVFKGKTVFEIIPEERVLRVDSNNACSGLFVKVKTDAMSGLMLEWRWRAREFPKKKKGVLSNRSEDDFAARIYVIFEASNLLHSDVIEYVWDASLPAGSSAQSPYSDRIQLLVLESGAAGEGEWRKETRDVYVDFAKLFNRSPKHAVGRIAVMTDSDSTGTSARADYGEILLTMKEAVKIDPRDLK